MFHIVASVLFVHLSFFCFYGLCLRFFFATTNIKPLDSNPELPVFSEETDLTDCDSAVHEEKLIPTEDEVFAARQLATEGMTEQQIDRLKWVICNANLRFEKKYFDNIFERLSDPNDLTWNYLEQTGEIQIGWSIRGGIDMEEICQRENLTRNEFYAKYGTRVVTQNRYDAAKIIALLSELKDSVQNEMLRDDLQYLMDQIALAKETHNMEIMNDIYKKVHDLDYFLLRYGPVDLRMGVQDISTISKYYGTLSFYQ